MIYGKEGPLKNEWFRIFGGPRQRFHLRAPKTDEWARHEQEYYATDPEYISGAEKAVPDLAARHAVHMKHVWPLISGLEVEGEELPVEGDWREWVKGQGIYQPVLRALAQWVFLGAAELAPDKPSANGRAAGVAADAVATSGKARRKAVVS